MTDEAGDLVDRARPTPLRALVPRAGGEVGGGAAGVVGGGLSITGLARGRATRAACGLARIGHRVDAILSALDSRFSACARRPAAARTARRGGPPEPAPHPAQHARVSQARRCACWTTSCRARAAGRRLAPVGPPWRCSRIDRSLGRREVQRWIERDGAFERALAASPVRRRSSSSCASCPLLRPRAIATSSRRSKRWTDWGSRRGRRDPGRAPGARTSSSRGPAGEGWTCRS